MLRDNRFVTVNEITGCLNMNFDSAHHIYWLWLSAVQSFHKVIVIITDCKIESSTCWFLQKTFAALCNWTWYLPKANRHWRWNFGLTPPPLNQGSEWGWISWRLTKIEKILYSIVNEEGYAYSFWMNEGLFGKLHVYGRKWLALHM